VEREGNSLAKTMSPVTLAEEHEPPAAEQAAESGVHLIYGGVTKERQ
jgi:hypothetical protein